MKLAYKAYDSTGKAVDGTIECTDTIAATETLRRKGLYVAQITESETQIPTKAGKFAKAKIKRRLKGIGGQKLKNLAMFTRQLSVLVHSGTQLAEALGALERQAKPGAWRDTISDVYARVEEGASLSEAMEAHSNYFDAICCSLVATGESSGHLVEMLDRLATLKQKQLRLRNSIVGALIYPIILVFLSMAIFSLLLIFVVPRFSTLFESLDVALPASTQTLVNISSIFRKFWWAVLLLMAGAVFALVTYLRSPNGRRLCDTVMLKLPCIGNITKSLTTARIICLLGVLMEGHVPVLKALRLVKRAAGNVLYADLIAKAEKHVTNGEQLSLAFADANLISPCVHEAIHSGEQSGQIDSLLLNISGFLDDENEVIIRSLTSIIEPLILVIMGVLVGLIAISMFMPLFDLTSMTQGGG
jgi:type IV pilus assembly protein PilC